LRIGAIHDKVKVIFCESEDTMKRTEGKIVAAFGELLCERPLNRITVKDIVQRAGVNRNTFYYYFQDIPTLVVQTVKEQIDHIIQTYSKFGTPMDCIIPLIQFGTTYKQAILNIYRSVQRDTFLTGLNELTLYIVTEYAKTTTANLTRTENWPVELKLLIRYHKCILVGVILDWLDAGMEYDLLAAAHILSELLSKPIEQVFQTCLPTTGMSNPD